MQDNNNQYYDPDSNMGRGSGQPTGQGGNVRRPAGRPSGQRQPSRPVPRQNPQQRPPQGGYQPRSAAPRQVSGRRRRRRQRPTAFILLLAVFIVLLLIIIFTSKSCKSFMSSLGGDDTESSASDTVGDTSESETSDTASDIADDSTEESTEAVTSGEPVETAEPDEEGVVPDDGVFTICIDPGHGFGDVGASSDYLGDLYEKDINLIVAQMIYDIIAEDGYNVILTHDGITFPLTDIDDGDNLYYINERSYYANTQDCDLFVSIHCDSYTNPDTSGVRVYYCTDYTYSAYSLRFAAAIKAAVDKTTLSSNAVSSIGFEGSDAYYVTRHVNCPSVLIELGFISNESDTEKLLDEEWQAEISAVIASAVESFANTGGWEDIE